MSVGRAFTVCLLLLLLSLTIQAAENPHYDRIHGVDRIQTLPATIGECTQCHELHGEEATLPVPKTLFTSNNNQLCYSAGGPNGCHAQLPTGYPASEEDRLPAGATAPGYFEANAGGTRLPGVLLRRRWPGETVYEDERLSPSGHYYSPHRNDLDMPLLDDADHGLCLNCHDAHEGSGEFDLLTGVYQSYGGNWSQDASVRYALCLDCHGPGGPFGMDQDNLLIADYYDRARNGDSAGHAIQMNEAIAISWPAHISRGDPLACYNCHNPHGSRGADGASPNAFLISDQRPGWWGLTDTRTDPAQSRRFCLGCHIPTNGIPGSIQVEGIVMNTLSSEPPHSSTAVEGCFECHGSDYSNSESKNVHNPADG